MPLKGLEAVVVDAGRRELEARFNAVRLTDREDSFLGMLFVLHSLGKAPDLISALEKRIRELEELNSESRKKGLAGNRGPCEVRQGAGEDEPAQGQVYSEYSHELRTPLDSILGFSDVLMERDILARLLKIRSVI